MFPEASGADLELWRTLLAAHPDPHPFLEPAVAWAWTELAHTRATRLEIVRAGDRALAVLQRDRRGGVSLLGGEDLTDYPGPVLGDVSALAAALLDRLADDAPTSWRSLDVRGAWPPDGLAEALQHDATQRGLATTRPDTEPVAVLDLPDSAERYERELLTRHRRQELSRKRRRLHREHPDARVRSADPATLADDLATFAAFMRGSPGEKGRFLTPAREAFLHTLAAASPIARIDILETPASPLAITFGFTTSRAFFLYNMAVNPDARALSPGIVLVAELIEQAIADRRERFDFMRGLERYKLGLGARARAIDRIAITREPTW